jgi:hypothetical protein
MKKFVYVLLIILPVLFAASCKKEIGPVQQAGQNESQYIIHIGGNVWTSLGLANVPFSAMMENQTFTTNNELYVALLEPNSLWQYDPPTQVWTQKKAPFFNTPMDFPDTKCVFTNGNNLYFLTFSTRALNTFNLATGLWSSLGSFPGTAGVSAATTYTATKGYIMSGGSLENWEYDFVANSWTRRTNVPGAFPRFWPVAYAVGANIYFGTGQSTGFFFNPVTQRPYTAPILTSDWYAFNISSNTWTIKAPFGPGSREDAMGFALGGKIYMGMGYDSTFSNNITDLWSYDPAANNWAKMASYPNGGFPPQSTSLFNAVGVNGLGYIVGQNIQYFNRYTPPYSLSLLTAGTAGTINLP